MHRASKPFRTVQEAGPYISFLLHIKAIIQPPQRILFNVLPYFQIIRLSTNHMVVERSLNKAISRYPHLMIDLLCHLVFIPADYFTQRRGRVSRPALILNKDKQMNMIRHQDVIVYSNTRIFYRYLLNVFFRNHALLHRDGRPVPYNVTQDFSAFLCTYCHKICTIASVIKFWQPVWFSFREFHINFPLICKTGGAIALLFYFLISQRLIWLAFS